MAVAEDRRIALAALAVAAVVPIATLFFGNLHDSNQFHAQQVQADRIELREVLDAAAGSLSVTRTRLDDARRRLRAIVTSTNDLGSSLEDRLTTSVIDPLQKPIDALSQSHYRVVIRLGSDSVAARRMARAVKAAGDVRDATRQIIFVAAVSEIGGKDRVKEHATATPLSAAAKRREHQSLAAYNAAVECLGKTTERFVDEANRVARSTLD